MINYSIITPHFESLDVLRRAVDSIPERDDIELIIVDNSRTPIDTTLFSSRKNVHIYYSPCGRGAGAARNAGLRQAQGKWLLFLDADDFFTPNAFEYIDKFMDSDADIVFFKTTSCYSDSLRPANRNEPTNNIIDLYFKTKDDSALRYDWKAPWAKLIRHALVSINNICFDEVKASNDIMFSLKVGYYARTIAVSSDFIYCVTIHQGSLTLTPSLENLTARIDVACRYNAFIKKHNINYHQLSIMLFLSLIYKSYGFLPALRLLFFSIKKGNNPFNGISRWYNTYKNLRNSN